MRQFERVEELFFQASGLPAADRDAFLDTAVPDDPSVREEVRRMLVHACGSGNGTSNTPDDRIGNVLASLVAAPASHPGSEDLVRQLVGTRVGAYELVDVLGQGGMGVVYLARDARLNRRVALKFVHAERERDPDTLGRFHREARAASSLSSPHICTIYEFDEHGGVPFIAMEFVEGRTIGDCAVGATPREVVAWTAQVAGALRTAHSAGIIHRDIKPANILVRPDGLVKVLDFGMARLLTSHIAGGTSGAATVTQPNTLLGTIRYMSPEQARCEPAGAESDVFSLGIVLYELLTRRHPFETTSHVGTLQAILTQSPLPPSRLDPAIPPDFDYLVLRMLSKDSRLRPTAAEVAASLSSLAGEQAAASDRLVSSTSPASAAAPVGRDQELRSLAAAYESAARGRGRIVCVTGEAGIGKTTLVHSFLDRLPERVRPVPAVARGRCSERLAGAEAYLPVLEAIDALLRGPEREAMNRLVKVLAPSWYAQAAPIARDESELGPKVDAEPSNNSQERLRREMLAFLEEATRDKPLVLFFDDLHWADPSTVDLLSYLGAKCSSMRLLLLNTYRSSDLLLSRHPLLPVKQELQAKGVCEEVALALLGRGDVQAYVDREFAGHRFPSEFISFVHQRSSGSPLFMVDLLRYLRDTGALCQEGGDSWSLAKGVSGFQRDLPESVRSMVQRKIDQLSYDEGRLLSAASVQGAEFDAAVVSGALRLDPADVEERLLSLDRLYGIVRRIGEKEFADGTLTVHYAFVHVLYQNALYASLQPSRRASLSAAVAARLLALHNGDGRSAAAELALLYEAARDFPAAAEYSLHAAGNAARLHAYRESAVLALRGLDHLKRLPESPQRNRLELRLQVALGMATQTTSNVFDASSIASLRRARELCVELGDAARLSVVLWGIWVHHAANGQYRVEAYEYGSELLRLAESTADVAVAMQAHLAMGMTHMHRGEHSVALPHFERVIGLHVVREHASQQLIYGQHPAVLAYGFGGLSLCYSGRLEEWRQWACDGINLATAIADPPSQSFALFTYLWASHVAGDLDGFAERAEEFHRLSHEHQLALWMAAATVFRGFLLARRASAPAMLDDAIDVIRQGITQLRPTHAAVALPLCLTILAEQLIRRRRLKEALAAVDEGLSSMVANGNTYAAAELRRLRAEVINTARESSDRESGLDGLPADVEPEFIDALAVARSQGAKTLEWRVVISLGRWLKQHGRQTEADDLLRPMVQSMPSQALARIAAAVDCACPD